MYTIDRNERILNGVIYKEYRRFQFTAMTVQRSGLCAKCRSFPAMERKAEERACETIKKCTFGCLSRSNTSQVVTWRITALCGRMLMHRVWSTRKNQLTGCSSAEIRNLYFSVTGESSAYFLKLSCWQICPLCLSKVSLSHLMHPSPGVQGPLFAPQKFSCCSGSNYERK